jgi:hypothetical protein
MSFDLMFLRAFLALSAFAATAFLYQRARFKRRYRKGIKHPGFYPSVASLGNALQSLQTLAQPDVQYILEEKLDESEEEDDEADPCDPARRLNRQLEQIRLGQPVDRLQVPFHIPIRRRR